MMDHSTSHPHFDLRHLRSPIEPAHRGRAQRLVEAAERIGLVRALRGLHDRSRPTLTILAYHRIMPTDALETYPFDAELISATPNQFESQMRHLRDHLNPVSLQEVIAHVDNDLPFPRAPVAVTFDDGFADTYRYAFPILKRYSIPATIFVSTGYVDSGDPFWFELAAYLVYHVSPHALEFPDGRTFPTGESRESRISSLRQVHETLKDLPNLQRTELIHTWSRRFEKMIAHDTLEHGQPISWHQIHEMAGAGIDFGSHTVTHPNLTRLTDNELQWELAHSKHVLESHLQRPIQTLAYPIGTPSAFNARVIAATRERGFKLGVTYCPGPNRLPCTNPHELRRHGVGLAMTTSYFRALNSLPSWLD